MKPASPTADSQPALPTASLTTPPLTTDRYLTLTFRRTLAADDILWQVQVSDGLTAWSGDTTRVQLISDVPNPDGTATTTVRSLAPFSISRREFIRLSVQRR